jgi:hypothetical protein
MEEEKLQSSSEIEHNHEEQTCSTNGNKSRREEEDKQKEHVQLHPQKKTSRKRPSRSFTREYWEKIQECVRKRRKSNSDGDSKDQHTNDNNESSVEKESAQNFGASKKSKTLETSPHETIEAFEDEDDDTSLTRSSSIRGSASSLQNSDAALNSVSVRESEKDIIEIISSDEEEEEGGNIRRSLFHGATKETTGKHAKKLLATV